MQKRHTSSTEPEVLERFAPSSGVPNNASLEGRNDFTVFAHSPTRPAVGSMVRDSPTERTSTCRHNGTLDTWTSPWKHEIDLAEPLTPHRAMESLLFSGGPVFGHPPGVSVLTRGGRIAAVGPIDDVAATARSSVLRVDLAGRMLLAGFQDAHVHPVMGGLQRLRCDLEPADDLEAGLAIIRRHAATTPPGEWVLGGGWRYRWFPDGNAPAALLDQVTDRPVWLVVADGHSGWANQTALRLAGIDEHTPDPADGVIVRLPDCSPQGTLHEGAVDLMKRVVPPDDSSDIRAALLESQDYFLSLGITAWQDAWVTPDIHEAYLDVAESGELGCRVRGALWWDRDRDIGQLDELIERAGRRAANYVPGTVKLMLDGVCENFTASMLEPYCGSDGLPTTNRGLDFLDPEELPSIVAAIDAAGLQCHFHALGDRAVRNALDAIEHARRVNGVRDTRPHLAHVQLIDPVDVDRFAALDAGLAMGSDWSVSTPDVMQQVGVAVSRTRPSRGVDDPLLPDERLPLEVALAAATAGSARINFHDDDSGIVAPGFRADLVVLSGDPVREDPFDLDVAITVLDGEIVYQS